MFLNNTDSSNMVVKSDSSKKDSGQNTQDGKSELRKTSTNFSPHSALVHSVGEKSTEVSLQGTQKNSVHHLPSRPADWAVALEATTKRRTEVLAPENLDNMWTKGRNYQKKTAKLIQAGALLGSVNATSGLVTPTPQAGSPGKELVANMSDSIKGIDENYMAHLMHGIAKNEHISYDPEKKQCMEMALSCQNEKNTGKLVTSNKIQLKRSSSTSDMDTNFLNRKGESTSSKENHRQDSAKLTDEESARVVPHMEGYLHTPKIKCRVNIIHCNITISFSRIFCFSFFLCFYFSLLESQIPCD